MTKPNMVEILEYYEVHGFPRETSSWRSVRCPFHDDRNASARYISNGDAQAFHCNACGISGDSIKVIEKVEGLDFKGALEFAEQITGKTYGDGKPQAQRHYKPMRLGESAPERRQQPARKRKKRRRRLA